MLVENSSQRALAGPGIGGSTCGDHSTLTRPLAPPDRAGASGRITPRQNFRALNLLLVVTPQRLTERRLAVSFRGGLCVLIRTVCADFELPVRYFRSG